MIHKSILSCVSCGIADQVCITIFFFFFFIWVCFVFFFFLFFFFFFFIWFSFLSFFFSLSFSLSPLSSFLFPSLLSLLKRLIAYTNFINPCRLDLSLLNFFTALLFW